MTDDEIIWGAPAIAKHIKRPLRQTYYMLERGHLPAVKVGSLWAFRPSALRRKFEEAEGAGEAAA